MPSRVSLSGQIWTHTRAYQPSTMSIAHLPHVGFMFTRQGYFISKPEHFVTAYCLTVTSSFNHIFLFLLNWSKMVLNTAWVTCIFFGICEFLINFKASFIRRYIYKPAYHIQAQWRSCCTSLFVHVTSYANATLYQQLEHDSAISKSEMSETSKKNH